MWSEVAFGKWAGKRKTLPQIIVTDPDWFFWAVKNDIFAQDPKLNAESLNLYRRARSIKIPEGNHPKDRVRYWFHREGFFTDLELVEAGHPKHLGSSTEIRLEFLDLSVAHSAKSYDKLGSKELIKGFKKIWFDGQSLTKKRIEAFFSDTRNFRSP